MYEETKEDIQRIIELKTVTTEAKARMILELVMDQDLEQQRKVEVTRELKQPDLQPAKSMNFQRNQRTESGSQKNKSWDEHKELMLKQEYFELLNTTRTKKGLYAKLGKKFGRTPTAIEVKISKMQLNQATQSKSIAQQIPAKRKYRRKGDARLGRKRVNQEEVNKIANTLKNASDLSNSQKVNLISKLVNRTPKAIYNFFKRIKENDALLRKSCDISELRKILIEQPSRKRKLPVTQTEIDTVYKERRMGTHLTQIAKLLNIDYKRAEKIDYKIRKGIFVPSNKKDKDNVEVGQSTSMPRKYNYMR